MKKHIVVSDANASRDVPLATCTWRLTQKVEKPRCLQQHIPQLVHVLAKAHQNRSLNFVRCTAPDYIAAYAAEPGIDFVWRFMSNPRVHVKPQMEVSQKEEGPLFGEFFSEDHDIFGTLFVEPHQISRKAVGGCRVWLTRS